MMQTFQQRGTTEIKEGKQKSKLLYHISFEMLSINLRQDLVFQKQIGFPVSSNDIMKCLKRKAA